MRALSTLAAALLLLACGDDSTTPDLATDAAVDLGPGLETAPDTGPALDSVPDLPVGDTRPDQGQQPDQIVQLDVTPADQGQADGAPTPDAPGQPDQQVPPDASPTLDAPPSDTAPTPDAPLTDAPTADAVPAPDLLLPDAAPVPDLPIALPCIQVIGAPCTPGGYECGTLGTCLLTSSSTGVCSCACTPDNPNTPLVNEDTCPGKPGNICGTIGSGALATSYCFETCQPKLGANDCQGNLACDPSSGAAVDLYGRAVCAFAGCETDADCPVITSTPCTTNTNPSGCPTGEECLAVTDGTTDGYCARPGVCDTASGLCGVHALGTSNAKVGDPCLDDTDCAGNMTCLMEIDWSKYRKKGGQSCSSGSECCSGTCQAGTCATGGLCTVDFRNGYCSIRGCMFAATLTSAACPSGSVCNRLYTAGLCQKTCNLTSAAQCRGNPGDLLGDYECRAWDNLVLDNAQIAPSPVCDFGTLIDCAIFSGSSLDCTALGTVNNPTYMTCRGLDDNTKTDPHDPTGFCLDNTKSGSQPRSPLPAP